MKNNKLKKELNRKLLAEEIVLPESLSAENIEKLIREQGGIVNPKRKQSEKGKIIRLVASAAAVIVCIIALAVVLDVTTGDRVLQKQNAVIAEKTKNSDYSQIESAVLTKYQDMVNSYQDSNGLFDGFVSGSKDTALPESAVGNTSSTNGSAAAGTTDLLTEDDVAFSQTNVQVDGVDEGDIIKNDGRYLYFLHDNLIEITDCADPKNMKVISKIRLAESDGYTLMANEMYLTGNTLTVITNRSSERDYIYNSYAAYDCCVMPDYDTVIKVYDVSDKANPTMVYSQLVNGEYLSSRVVGGKLLCLTRYAIPFPELDQKDFEKNCEELKNSCIPEYSVNGGEMQKIEPDRIDILDEKEPTSYVVTAIIDLSDLTAEPKMNASLSDGYEIYCTNDTLFLASSEYAYWTASGDGKDYVEDDNGRKFTEVTHIYRFAISDEGVFYKASATVGGVWLNQFSMDQYGDEFRIATTGCEYNGTRYSMVYVLDQDMKIKGYLGGIADGEEIYAARFMGKTLYLVTFYQTDPLFVIDLSDSKAPVLKGELKLPGFSSYLHPVSENLVVGIGVGGTMNGTDGSAKISLFDVSDPCNPKELDNYTVPDAYFDTDHRAFMTVDGDTFGVAIFNYSYDASYAYQESRSVILFDVSDEGITVKGQYATLKASDSDMSYTCRGAFIGDTLFAVNGAGIIAYNMSNSEKLGEIRF